jgi:hypothetical protein
MKPDSDDQVENVRSLALNRRSFGPLWTLISCILIAVGAVVFLYGISGSDVDRTWHAYLVNYLFWFSLAFGIVLFGPVMNMTGANWARPTKRLTEAFGPFLILSLPMFWLLYMGRERIFVWILNPVPEKAAWLNTGFMFVRNSIGLSALTAFSLALIYYSLKGDRMLASSIFELETGDLDALIEKGERLPSWRKQVFFSPVVAITFGLALSCVGLDLAMSLEPHWYSTLFPGYYFVNSFYIGLAALAIISSLALNSLGLKALVKPYYFHDLGKILFGFCMMSGYFFYSQFIVIWYGNLPEETRYLIERFRYTPWETLSYVILIITFFVPIFILLFRRVKMSPLLLSLVSVIILLGYWLERFLLVEAVFWKGKSLPIGIPEVGIAAGFFGLVGLSVTLFLRQYPILPISDPLFLKFLKREREKDLEEERQKFGFV